jgi:hypothetical protein
VNPTCRWCGHRDAAAFTPEPICATCNRPVPDPPVEEIRDGVTCAKILRAIDAGAETRDQIADALGCDLTTRSVQLTFNRLLHWLRQTGQVTAIAINPRRKRPEYRYAPGARRRAAA